MKNMESRIIFRVEPRVEQRVEQLVEQLGEKKSEIVRRALLIGLDTLERRAPQMRPQRKPKG